MRAGLARGIKRGRKATLFEDESEETYVAQTAYHKVRGNCFDRRSEREKKKRKEDGVNPSGVLGSGGGQKVRGAHQHHHCRIRGWSGWSGAGSFANQLLMRCAIADSFDYYYYYYTTVHNPIVTKFIHTSVYQHLDLETFKS